MKAPRGWIEKPRLTQQWRGSNHRSALSQYHTNTTLTHGLQTKQKASLVGIALARDSVSGQADVHEVHKTLSAAPSAQAFSFNGIEIKPLRDRNTQSSLRGPRLKYIEAGALQSDFQSEIGVLLCFASTLDETSRLIRFHSVCSSNGWRCLIIVVIFFFNSDFVGVEVG